MAHTDLQPTPPRVSVCEFYNIAKVHSKDRKQQTLPRDGILLCFGLCVVASMVAAMCTAGPVQETLPRDGISLSFAHFVVASIFAAMCPCTAM